MKSFIQTDDLQYCLNTEGSSFVFVEAFETENSRADETDGFSVYTGYVNLCDYTDEEIEDCVKTYYPSIEDFMESYNGLSEGDKNQLLAEMIFESNMEDNSCLGLIKEEDLEDYMNSWMEWYAGNYYGHDDPEEDIDR